MEKLDEIKLGRRRPAMVGVLGSVIDKGGSKGLHVCENLGKHNVVGKWGQVWVFRYACDHRSMLSKGLLFAVQC